MKSTSTLLIAFLSTVGVSQAAFIATDLPNAATDAGVAANTTYGSAFTITAGNFFSFDTFALYDDDGDGFATPQGVALYKSDGANFNFLEGASFNGTGSSTSIGGNIFATTAASGAWLGAGTYFLGFSGAATPEDYLSVGGNFHAPVGADGNTNIVENATLNANGLFLGGFATVSGNLPGSFLQSSVTFSPPNRANMNIFAGLTAVPEVGSLFMGSLLGLMATSYRRRK